LSETPFFFALGNERLFGMHHRPAGSGRRAPRRGVVLCHALAEEKLWSHRVYVSLARELAAQGFAVLRFDCRGEGDSDLEFEEATLASRVEDALRAAAVLLEREPQLRRCVFLGHRMGAVVAARAAAQAPDLAEALIAWDPIESGSVYLMQWLRSALASQLVATGRAPTRSALVKALEEGRTVTIDGYGITPRLYRELAAVHWAPLVEALACPALVVEGACEPPFWRQTPRMHMRAPAMTERSVQWLRQAA
jgi:alpha-beta hydrolase superfamily lysophospholipase